MPMTVAVILGVVAAIAGTVVAFVMIIPEKKREGFKSNKVLLWLHDFLNFKTLWIEKILKCLYVLMSLIYVCVGFFMLFSASFGQYMGGYGLLLIIFGPILTRVVYEFCMLSILTVKNLAEINNKLVPQKGSVADEATKTDDVQFEA